MRSWIGAVMGASSRRLEDTAGGCMRRLAVAEREDAVDEDVADADRALERLFIARTVADGCGIEHEEVGREPRRNPPAVGEVEAIGRGGRHLADRLGERKEGLFARV